MSQKLDISQVNKLEKELNLKELQIKSLLNITQAINNNVSAKGLYNMYKDFLSWEMSVNKMALFTQKEDEWECVTSIEVNYPLKSEEVEKWLLNLRRLHTITQKDPQIVQDFNIVVPVYHKEEPIAFALIGGFQQDNNLYSKVQFITTITNIIAVAIENKRLFKDRLEQERYQRELELASEVQHWLIPQSFPKHDRYDVGFFYKPHFNVGGDYFDFFPIDDQNFYYCIADISGKGVSAAILMANFQAILKSKLTHTHEDLKEVVIELNEAVHSITLSDKFITFFIAHVNLKEDKIDYINAGHNPPMFYYDRKIEYLDKGTTVLGAEEDLPFIDKGSERIEEDTMLFNFTDGLIDLENENGDYFTIDLVKTHLLKHGHRKCEEFINKLKDSLEDFKGERSFPDDIAVLSFKIFKDKHKNKNIETTSVSTGN